MKTRNITKNGRRPPLAHSHRERWLAREAPQGTYISRRLTASDSHCTEVRWSPRGSCVNDGSAPVTRMPE